MKKKLSPEETKTLSLMEQAEKNKREKLSKKLNYKDRQELEIDLIGAILNYPQKFFQVFNLAADAKDLFQNPNNLIIYKAILTYYNAYNSIPSISEITQILIQQDRWTKIENHFNESFANADFSPSPEVENILIRDTIEREIEKKINSLHNTEFRGLELAEYIREEFDDLILDKTEKYAKDHRSNREKVDQTLKMIYEIKRGESNLYIPSGLSNLDHIIGGFPKAHLTIIAARPGGGKTAFALQLRRNFSENGYKPGFLSLEMTTDEIMIRDLSHLTKIDSHRMETGHLSDDEYKQILRASDVLAKDNFVIDDGGSQTTEKIRSTIKNWMATKKVDIVLIDYLTLIRTSYGAERRDLEIGRLSSDLREFAKAHNIPIIILSQLNRESEKRNDKRPYLTDLRESGQIEQDAKLVLFLYRPMHWGINPFEEESREFKHIQEFRYETISREDLKPEEYLECIIGKNRSGKTGAVPLRYIRNIHTFEPVKTIPKNNYFNNRTEEVEEERFLEKMPI